MIGVVLGLGFLLLLIAFQAPLVAALGVLTNLLSTAAAFGVAVFFTFALSGPLPPKEMGAILGVAVLLDAFLVRLLLVPVLLRLTGDAAWWLPGWLDQLLPNVSFGHGGEASAGGEGADGDPGSVDEAGGEAGLEVPLGAGN